MAHGQEVLYFHNLQYQADQENQEIRKMAKILGILGLKFDKNGPYLGTKILLSTP
jgi:hypothetical protein